MVAVLKKILGILGHNRERKFISKCNDPNERNLRNGYAL